MPVTIYGRGLRSAICFIVSDHIICWMLHFFFSSKNCTSTVHCTFCTATALCKVLCTAPGWCKPMRHNKICLYDIFLPMLCAPCLCVSVLLGSPLGRVPWARPPRQKLQLDFENHFESLAGVLHLLGGAVGAGFYIMINDCKLQKSSERFAGFFSLYTGFGGSVLPHLPKREWGFCSILLQAFPQPLSRDIFCTLKQKAPDTWWVSISGHWGVAEVFVLCIAVVVNTMSQVKYRCVLKKLR